MYDDLNRLLSFCSVRQALLAEEVFARIGISGALVPTPRRLGIHCGQCMLFQGEKQADVLSLLKEKNIQWSKLYKRNVLADSYELYAENDD